MRFFVKTIDSLGTSKLLRIRGTQRAVRELLPENQFWS